MNPWWQTRKARIQEKDHSQEATMVPHWKAVDIENLKKRVQRVVIQKEVTR